MQRDPEGGLFEGCTLAKLAETGSGYGVDGTRSVPEPVLEQKRVYATAVSLLLCRHPTLRLTGSGVNAVGGEEAEGMRAVTSAASDSF